MAGTLSPAAKPPYPINLVVPLNTEPLDASQEQTLDQALLDGVEGARLQLYGQANRQIAALSSTVITIQPLGAVTVKVGGQWQVFPHKVVSTYTPAGLVANSRYYLYAYASAGSIAFIHTVDVPDAGRFYKAGDEQYLFLGTFLTISGGALMRYVQNERDYLYNDASTQCNQVVTGGNAVGGTTTALGVSVPPGAFSVLMLGSLPTSSAGRSAFVRSTTDIRGFTLQDIGAGTDIAQGRFSLNGLDTFDWGTSNAGCALDVFVYGFTF